MLARGLKARSMMATMGERGKEHNRLSGLEDADDATTAAAATEIPNPSLLFHFSSLVPSLVPSLPLGPDLTAMFFDDAYSGGAEEI